MHYKKNFFVLFLLIFFKSTLVFSNNSIVYIDIQYIIDNSNFGKNVTKEINDINNRNIKEITSKQNYIKDLENEINKVKNVISKEELEKKINEYKEEVKLQNIFIENKKKSFDEKRKEKISNLFNKITPIIENYMKKNSINFIIEKKFLFIAETKYDITQEILDAVNKELK